MQKLWNLSKRCRWLGLTILVASFCIRCTTRPLEPNPTPRDPSGKAVEGGGDPAVPPSLRYEFSQTRDLSKNPLKIYIVDLNALKNSKVIIKEILSSDSRINEALATYQQQLKDFGSQEDLSFNFRGDAFDVRLKSNDFKRLAQFLALVDQSQFDFHQGLRLKAEALAAFRQQLMPPIEFAPDLVTIPIKGLEAISPYSIQMNSQAQSSAGAALSTHILEARNSLDLNRQYSLERLRALKLSTEVCSYEGPKKGYGVHLGMRIQCGQKRYKLKLAEENSAPMNSRLYRRIGYFTPVLLNVPLIEVKYQKALFLELHSGKKNAMPVKAFGKTLLEIPAARHTDIDTHLKAVKLKGEQAITAKDFFARLFPSCQRLAEKCFLDANKYDADFESRVESLLFENVAVEEDDRDHEFGSWGYDDLDHSELPEIRGLVLVGAFSGNNDLRKDNNKLVWDRSTNRLLFKISDPGTGYGSGGMFAPTRVNEVSWEILKTSLVNNPREGSDLSTERIDIINYRTNSNHKAFHQLTLAEAQTLARRIANISMDDLTRDLVDSGFAAAEVLVLREKLRSRQKNLVMELKLASEFPDLVNFNPQKKLNFNSSDSIYNLKLSTGESIEVPTRGIIVDQGKLYKSGSLYMHYTAD